MNIIDTKPVGKIILNEQTPERSKRIEHYLIPYYQRGYRWDEENVRALLEDVHNFTPSDKELKYCLQPIVVVPTTDAEGFTVWEVIDGQQRLITLHIIFQVMNKPRYKIIFEKRDKSNDFLDGLSEAGYNHQNPDFHFMSEAHRIATHWFNEKSRNDVGYIDDFNAKLTKKVELIWYQVQELANIDNEDEAESKKIDIFNRLNVGKIPLTDAELIRALLLSKVKYGLIEREANFRQSELSAEWHRIDQELRKDRFWYFLNKKPLEEVASTIEFIFQLMASGSSRKYSTYLWFEKQIKADTLAEERDKAGRLWQTVKEYFGKLKHWYEDDFLYHHLGFKLILEDNSLLAVRAIIENSNCTKSAFKDWAFDEVKRKMDDVELDKINYEKNAAQIKRVFLLHNILLSIGKSGKTTLNRFAFDQYRKIENEGGWSIEHIHAQQSKEMKEAGAIRRWLEETYAAIKDLKTTDFEINEELNNHPSVEELAESVRVMKDAKEIDVEAFNRLKIQIVQRFDSGSIHVLDNLALLATRHNSELSNGIFAVKRKKIITMDKDGKFIPPATRNVFLKYYSHTDLQPFFWSRADKKNYIGEIKSKLEPYLKSAN